MPIYLAYHFGRRGFVEEALYEICASSLAKNVLSPRTVFPNLFFFIPKIE